MRKEFTPSCLKPCWRKPWIGRRKAGSKNPFYSEAWHEDWGGGLHHRIYIPRVKEALKGNSTVIFYTWCVDIYIGPWLHVSFVLCVYIDLLPGRLVICLIGAPPMVSRLQLRATWGLLELSKELGCGAVRRAMGEVEDWRYWSAFLKGREMWAGAWASYILQRSPPLPCRHSRFDPWLAPDTRWSGAWPERIPWSFCILWYQWISFVRRLQKSFLNAQCCYRCGVAFPLPVRSKIYQFLSPIRL